jgi:diguanylate cyclase (GGDEF)-like protein/PAS domain S-box-containing protein
VLRLRSFFTDLSSKALRACDLVVGAIVCSLMVAVLAIYGISSQAGSRPTSLSPNELLIIPSDDLVRSPHDALETALSPQGGTRYKATTQPPGPFWLVFKAPLLAEAKTQVIELRMLRATNLSFWSYKSIDDHLPVELEARNEKGGISVEIQADGLDHRYVVGWIDPLGLSRPKAFAWDLKSFSESQLRFERSGGSLIAVFAVLSFLSLFVGTLNRDWSFIIFAGWLLTSLRVAAINDGWDLLWLGLNLESEFLLLILRVTLAAHPLLTAALFISLLRHELSSLNLLKPLQTAQVAFLGIFIFSPFVESRTLLPIIWGAAAIGMVLILGSLVLIVAKVRNAVALWYATSWLLTFSGYFLEVAYASGILSIILPGINTQTTSIASAAVATIALAEKLRFERVERVMAQKDKLDALHRLKATYDSIPVGLFSLNSSGTISLYNPAFLQLFGIETNPSPTSEMTFDKLIGVGSTELLSNSANSGMSEVEFSSEEHRYGKVRWFLAKVTAKGNSIEGSIQDITERKEAEAQLRHLVDHDALTGLSNRRGLERSMSEAQSMVAQGVPCAVAHLALDRFKLINDLYGHGVGDTMLQMAASRLMQTVRARDHVARMADSFVVVFFDCPDFATLGLSERLREVIMQAPFEVDGKRLDMTASVGVVCFDPELGMVDTLASAGRACAEAKARGRNCVVRLDDSDNRLRSHLEELKVVADLKRKINPDRYFLDFQPIVSLHRPDESLNYEVLLRMRDEFGGVIPPGRFIGAAERNGLMSDIDRWVLRSTLEWLDTHPAHRDRLAFATINISGASLNDSRFIDDAFAMIADHPLAMPKLCFEITESVALNDLNSTRRFIDRVRQYGSKLALDDFGAGYTSFNYLKEIPADFIKIDGSFVRDINLNPANYAITRTIVDLTHELGMRSIAEWAETPETVEALIELGVDYGQGFGLARAMDKQIVTDAASCGTLVRDRRVLEIFATLSRDGVIAGN